MSARVQVNIRLKDRMEKELLRSHAYANGMSVSEWIRARCVYASDTVMPVIDSSPLSKTLWELNKHGVNLNQLMKFLHVHGLEGYTASDVRQVLAEERVVFARVTEMLRAIHREAERYGVFLLDEKDSVEKTNDEDAAS